MRALIVKQRGMLDDTRRRMKKAYRSMEKRIISLEREVRVSLRVLMTICTLFTYLLVTFPTKLT
jgi:hypothetical protein